MREGWLHQEPADLAPLRAFPTPAPLRAYPTPPPWSTLPPVWQTPQRTPQQGAWQGESPGAWGYRGPKDPYGPRHQGPPQVPRPFPCTVDQRGSGESAEAPPTFWREEGFKQPERETGESPRGTRQEVREHLDRQEAQAALLRKAEKRKRKQRAKKYRAKQAKAARARIEHSPWAQSQSGRIREGARDR